MVEEKENTVSAEEDEFEQMMQQRIQSNFSSAAAKSAPADPRLEEMSKKLPSWSLEPPYSFLK